MTALVLSIILAIGLAGGPSDFNDSCTTAGSQTISQSAN
jgi:hypothetical protein